MAGKVLKRRRLVNPGRRRMSNKQIKYFGTKRQKAALKNRNRGNRARRNIAVGEMDEDTGHFRPFRWSYDYDPTRLKRGDPEGDRARRLARGAGKKKKRRRNQGGVVSSATRAAESAIRSVEEAAEDAIHDVTRAVSNRGRRNVGEILTVVPANPGRKRRRNMPARRTNRARNPRRRNYQRTYATNPRYRSRNRNRARRNYGHRNYGRRASNPRVVVRYRNRKSNRGMRNRNRGRRNPDMLAGDAGAVVGLLGGAFVTNAIKGFLPAGISSGFPGYISTGIVAVVAGQLAGRMTSNKRIGNWVTIGGLLMVGLQVINDFFPQLALPFSINNPSMVPATPGTSGMGLITSSNFYVPQVNMPGSMASFVTPAGIPVVVPTTGGGMKGLGVATSSMNQGLRRIGRLR